MQSRNRALVFKGFQCPRISENNFELCTADHSLPCQDQTCGRSGFNQALQTIPACLWDLAQVCRRIEHKIDNYQWEVSIAQKQISRFDRIESFGATNPEQMTQTGVIR